MRWLAALVSLAPLVAGCGDDLTQLIVVVDSDLAAGAIDQLELTITGPSGARTMLSEPVGPAALALPATVGVVPEAGAELGPLTFVARGSLGGVLRVERSVRTDFLAGATRRVDLMLTGACYDVSCGGGTTCRAGVCVDDRLDAQDLPPWRGRPEPLDGGVVPPTDGGTADALDAAVDAPDSSDVGAPDAGLDDGPRPPQRVAAGAAHSCALASGVPYCWGSAAARRINVGGGGLRTAPVVSDGVTGALELALGRAHGCALDGDGRVLCWGAGGSGQRGGGTLDGGGAVAVRGLGGAVDDVAAVEVRARHDHSCARLETQRVVCWGEGGDGQLGDGALVDRAAPVEVVGVGDAVEVAVGEAHSCARRTFGEVMCWGSNAFGQLGDGTTDDAPTPVLVRGITDAVRIAAGAHHSCAVDQTGELRCWGRAEEGQLGDGRRSGLSTTPQDPVGLGAVVDVAAGRAHTCVTHGDGAVSCVGSGLLGQLGAGERTSRVTWVGALGLASIEQLAVGADHACSLRGTSAVRCWGDNTSGQVGDGESGTQVDVPTTVLGLP